MILFISHVASIISWSRTFSSIRYPKSVPCSEEYRCVHTYFSDIHACCAPVWGCPLDTTALGELAKLMVGQGGHGKEREKAPLLKSKPLANVRLVENPRQ